MTLSTTSEESLIDRAAVTEWMDGLHLGDGQLEQLEPLVGGTQNVMASFVRSGRRYILRRGPRHLRSGSNKVMGTHPGRGYTESPLPLSAARGPGTPT